MLCSKDFVNSREQSRDVCTIGENLPEQVNLTCPGDSAKWGLCWKSCRSGKQNRAREERDEEGREAEEEDSDKIEEDAMD